MLMETPSPNFQSSAPVFSLPDLQGKSVTLGDVMGPKGLVVAFISNHCPYVKAIIDRFVADAASLKDLGIGTVAIMPNDFERYPEDRPAKMIEFALKHAFGFPYLLDESQVVAKSYGAVCTPDFFGYDANGRLGYRGRLDNLRPNMKGERTADLFEAMTLMASSKPGPRVQHPSMGCSIKWR